MPADDLEPKPKEWVPLWLDVLDLAWTREEDLVAFLQSRGHVADVEGAGRAA